MPDATTLIHRPDAPPPRRWRAGAALLLGVLLAHALLLDGLSGLHPQRPDAVTGRPDGAPVITLLPRAPEPATVAPAPVPESRTQADGVPARVAGPPPEAPSEATTPAAVAGLVDGLLREVTDRPAPALRDPRLAPAPEPDPATPPPAATPEPDGAAPPAAEPALAAASQAGPVPLVPPPAGRRVIPFEPAPVPAIFAPPPVYPVDVPPGMALRYAVRRGPLAGTGEIRWRLGPDGYELSWTDQTAGRPTVDWHSMGELDAAGLAPQRMVESRRGRPLHAVNFQRDKGLISFSGPSTTSPLHPGAQDRASWLLQLTGVARAGGLALEPGGWASFQVAGARGDVELWTFRVIERVPLFLQPDQMVETVRLQRDPQRPYDLRVSVWLALAHGLLPVRVRLETVPQGEPMDWLLVDGLPARSLLGR